MHMTAIRGTAMRHVVVVRATPHHVMCAITGNRITDRYGWLLVCYARLRIRHVWALKHPFRDIAVHIIESPRIRLLCADRMRHGGVRRHVRAVAVIPRIFVDRTAVESIARPGTACVFPLHARREVEKQSRFIA